MLCVHACMWKNNNVSFLERYIVNVRGVVLTGVRGMVLDIVDVGLHVLGCRHGFRWNVTGV